MDTQILTSRYVNYNNCTLQTCPIAYAEVLYVPTLAGNALYIAIFSLLLPLQVFLGVRYRTWGYLGCLIGGLILEIVGYAARVQLHYNPFHKGPFVQYLVCLTIGPVFFTAAIYLCFAHLIIIYGEDISRLRPRTYIIAFVMSDVLSLILQAAGGGIAATAVAHNELQNGIHIMVAGLALQVASLLCFVCCCAVFSFGVDHSRDKLNILFAELRGSLKLRLFLPTLGLATLCILIRSCFRVAELSEGFGGKLANQETQFMILEGAMVIIACICLTVLHPGVAFQGRWAEANVSVVDMNHREKARGRASEQ